MRTVHIITIAMLLMMALSLPFPMSAQFNTIGKVRTLKKHKHTQSEQLTAGEDKLSGEEMEDANRLQHENSPMPSILPMTSWCHPPLKGTLRISSPFGRRRNPFDRRKTEFHSGLDLAATFGTPVYALMPGEVAGVGYDQRAGNYIKLSHGNFTISYCHLQSRPFLRIGSQVIAGQPIGQVGSSGRSTGPHLHLTLKRNGQVIDPAIMLRYFKFI